MALDQQELGQILSDLRNDGIETLDLSSKDLTTEQLIQIANALKDNTSLAHLDLGGNQIGVAGARAFAQGFQVNTGLTHLNLGDNQIGVAGARAIAEALKTDKTLTHLNLENNQIGVAGAIALAHNLQANTTLTHLDLENNQIGVAGAIALAQNLKANTTLIYLILGNNQISPEILTGISVYLARNIDLAEQRDARNALEVKGAIAEHLPPDIAELAMGYAVDFDITPEMRDAIKSEEQRLREERRPRSSSAENDMRGGANEPSDEQQDAEAMRQAIAASLSPPSPRRETPESETPSTTPQSPKADSAKGNGEKQK